MTGQDESFGKEERLTKTHQFKRVYNRGQSVANNLVVLYVLKKGDSKQRRVGFSVSKKIGKAVVRNKVKRRLKEVYRRHKNKLIFGIDLVVIARQGIDQATYGQIKEAMLDIYSRAQVLKD
ncbi:MAG: ribonuclease P protein component [Bacillota bacterium]